MASSTRYSGCATVPRISSCSSTSSGRPRDRCRRVPASKTTRRPSGSVVLGSSSATQTSYEQRQTWSSRSSERSGELGLVEHLDEGWAAAVSLAQVDELL